MSNGRCPRRARDGDRRPPDVCFATTLDGLRLQFAGGLSMDAHPAVFTSEEEAHEEAKTRPTGGEESLPQRALLRAWSKTICGAVRFLAEGPVRDVPVRAMERPRWVSGMSRVQVMSAGG